MAQYQKTSPFFSSRQNKNNLVFFPKKKIEDGKRTKTKKKKVWIDERKNYTMF